MLAQRCLPPHLRDRAAFLEQRRAMVMGRLAAAQQQAQAQQPAVPRAAAATSSASQQQGAGGFAAAGEEEEQPTHLCVVCWESATAVGLLHGDTMHLCVCAACAALVSEGQPCLMCNQRVQAKVRVFQA
jgi:hypothetical protein